MNFYVFVLVERNFRDFRDKGIEGFHNGNAAMAPRGSRLAPSRLLGDKIEDPEIAGAVFQQPAAELVRVLLGGGCKLVDEAFAEEPILRGTHRPPKALRNWARNQLVVDQNVGNIIR